MKVFHKSHMSMQNQSSTGSLRNQLKGRYMSAHEQTPGHTASSCLLDSTCLGNQEGSITILNDHSKHCLISVTYVYVH
ncbi:hypothetical protein IGI04_029865 [Brassica rapa subsp. trilocularis]|uniref:Uncharacterized protein n=1 Tax=Brassica rapa subsp. trilocularis TaxID=1813537 RepID=A0ABQ7LP13_BRACM|nr:hypothetical protein IGI04_029865 [Brassica rapa subsp. trilocularis]